jgi:hypothetical protein
MAVCMLGAEHRQSGAAGRTRSTVDGVRDEGYQFSIQAYRLLTLPRLLHSTTSL